MHLQYLNFYRLNLLEINDGVHPVYTDYVGCI